MGKFSLLSAAGLWLAACTGDVSKPGEANETAAASEAVRNTPEQKQANRDRLRRALEPVLSRKTDGLHSHLSPHGHVVVPLQGRYGHAMMARRGADGRLEYGCFDNVESAVEFTDSAAGEVAK